MKPGLMTYVAALMLAAVSAPMQGQSMRDSIEIVFRQGHSDIDTTLSGNRDGLERMSGLLQTISGCDSVYHIRKIVVTGAASPEGSVGINNRLSHSRAMRIFDRLASQTALPDSLTAFSFVGRYWNGLYRMVDEDHATPGRDEALGLIAAIEEDVRNGNAEPSEKLARLKSLEGGRAYQYMYSRMFPSLRATRLYVNYLKRLPRQAWPLPAVTATAPSPSAMTLPTGLTSPVRTRKPWYMAVKTNMLLDALALPNIGAEVYVGKNISVGANWMYGWWDNDHRHRYWRAYGGDLTARWWFGRKAAVKPLTGHHLGVFAGVVTYDFEFGGRGYMGGLPGRPLWDRCNLFAGVEYGYSLPVASRLNLDFSIGIGYMGGNYLEYVPEGRHYLWESTHRLNWFGPVKAEISLVWLIGHGNVNSGKGGKR